MRFWFFISVCAIRLFTQMTWPYLPYGNMVYYAGQSLFETASLILILSIMPRKEHRTAFIITLFFCCLSALDGIKIVFFNPFNISVWQYTGLAISAVVAIVSEIHYSLCNQKT